HHIRDLDLLRTDSRAGAATYAGGRTFFLRNGAKDGRIDGLAAGKSVLVVQPDQPGDIQLLWTVGGTVVTGCTGDGVSHVVSHVQKCILFLLIQRFLCGEGPDIFLQLPECGHSGQGYRHTGNGLEKAKGPS